MEKVETGSAATWRIGFVAPPGYFSVSAEPAMRPAYVSMNEQMVAAAVETQTDAVFMLENFCGHGFYTDDPNNECYRGPEAAELWFDPTCIHPNEAGHAALAGLFMDIVEE